MKNNYNIDINRFLELKECLIDSISYGDNGEDVSMVLSLIEDWAKNSYENLEENSI